MDLIAPYPYHIRGSGPGLLLLHGTGSTGLGSWATLLDGLAAGHTAVLPDLPGSGTNPVPERPLELDEVADQVAATAREAGLDRFAVAGASLGAAVAVRVAVRHPERVTRLVSMVGYARPRAALRLSLETWAALHARRDGEEGRLLAALSFSERFLSRLTEQRLREMTRELAEGLGPGTDAQLDLTLRVDVREDLPRVRVPTLVVAAAADRFVDPVHSREIAAAVPGARLVEVAGGHAAMFEDPRQTLSVLLDFLDRDRGR